MSGIKPVVGWVALGVLVIFTAFNWTYVQVKFPFIISVEMPLALIIIFAALLGAGTTIALRFLKKPPPK